MLKFHQYVKVSALPKCDFCNNRAVYDAKTHRGPWANMCQIHFAALGVGLGSGKGQMLFLENPPPQEIPLERSRECCVQCGSQLEVMDEIDIHHYFDAHAGIWMTRWETLCYEVCFECESIGRTLDTDTFTTPRYLEDIERLNAQRRV